MTAPAKPDNVKDIRASATSWRAALAEWSATHDYAALLRSSRRVTALAEDPGIAETLLPVRIGLAASATVDFLLPLLKASLHAVGLRPTLHLTPYGQIATSLLDHEGALTEFKPQVTIVAHAAPHLPAVPALTDSLPDVERRVDEVCRQLLQPCELFHQRTGSEIVLTNFHPLPWRVAGNMGARLPGDPVSFVRRVNLALSDRAPHFVHIFDVAALAERTGLAAWFDERYWHLAKQPMAFDSVPLFARHLAAVIGGLLGRSRKCLVIDLDNTLWGGVIGDDGLGGIRLGEGGAEAESFKAFQQYLRDLKNRGVLLAVCSKNTDAIARSPFLEHPDMVLRLEDFAAFKANWQPKSDNLREIARELDLPLDAFAFVDDNPAERDEVARALPAVAVVPMPDDPALFIRAVDEARLFESARLTDEDLRRTSTYHARRQSHEALAEVTDVRDYLASLEMVATVEPFTPVSFERITQLINKTNQFNLTTPRLVRAEVERIAADPAMITRTVRLRDRFGDHGLISVVFARISEDQLLVEAWLMSCRVLGRGVERLLFNELISAARRAGLNSLVGFYKPTDRNGLVRNHFSQLGFSSDGVDGGVERWRLRLDGAEPLETFIAADTPVASA